MGNAISIGFNIHPRWVQGSSLKAFLAPLREAGLNSLEFELDNHLPMWEDFEPLMEETVALGLQLSFHAAYRAPHTLLGYASGRKDEIQQDYRPLLQIAENWSLRLEKQHSVVFHAATAPAPYDTRPMVEDTVTFLQWVCAEFPHLKIALENNNPSSANLVKLGIQRQDVLALIRLIDRPQVGICWDMGHDALTTQPVTAPQEWVQKVIHVHLHDFDKDGQDHYPLKFGNVPYQQWLAQLKQAGMQGIVVLELKGERFKDMGINQIMRSLADSFSAIRREVSL
jgi:sugar phosphate isomerase/epimerase